MGREGEHEPPDCDEEEGDAEGERGVSRCEVELGEEKEEKYGEELEEDGGGVAEAYAFGGDAGGAVEVLGGFLGVRMIAGWRSDFVELVGGN